MSESPILDGHEKMGPPLPEIEIGKGGHEATRPLVQSAQMFAETHDDSWRSWRSVLARIEGLEPEDRPFIERVTARSDLTPAREVFIACGRSAGKTRVASVIASSFATRAFKHSVGEEITLGVFAPTVDQARRAHSYCKGLLTDNPATAALISGEITQTRIPLGDLAIECLPANFKTLRSRSFGLAIIDEACFLPQDDSAAPDTELLRAIRPGLARVTGSLLVVISSPYAKRGEMFKAYERYFGKAGARTLFIKGGTRDFNPTFDQAEIDRAMVEDPESARAEYLGEFRSDEAALFQQERVMACVPSGIYERPRPMFEEMTRVRAFVDAATGSGTDSFTAAIAATQGNTEVLLALREWRPPFSPAQVVEEAVDLIRSYGLRRTTGDNFAGGFTQELFTNQGVAYETSPLNRSGIYLEAVTMVNSGRCSLLDHPKLITQILDLERRPGRAMDSIDHKRGGHDDLANAAFGALVIGARKKRLYDCTW